MRLVFLDIDGVLNDHGCDPMSMCGEIHSAKVRTLNRLLFCTGAKLVLSSAWRYIVHRGEADFAGMDWLLRSHGLHAGRLIGAERDEERRIKKGSPGVTRPDTMKRGVFDGTAASWPMTNERGAQIADWINDHRLNSGFQESLEYVVIDDLDLGITDAGHPFVQTDGKVGITDADADRAIALFREQSRCDTTPRS